MRSASSRRHETATRLHRGDLESSDSPEQKSIRPHESAWHAAIGALVHQCAGDLADVRGTGPSAIVGAAIEWANANVNDTKVLGNLAKARSQVTSCACVYLTKYVPGPGARHLGAEIAFDGGRIDLAWDVPGLGVVVDEIKTHAWIRLNVDSRMLAQPRRYIAFGVSEWGTAFAGVRFLPLRHPGEARFLGADGSVARLSQSPAADVTGAAL